jgi:hypothetical protein
MAKETAATEAEEFIVIDLHNPGTAAFLAWLWPGAGHLYQRRYGKGVLCMVCILVLYFFGLKLSHGHGVYASWTKEDKRWQYICQVGIGLPALPALIQAARVFNGKTPWLDGYMAPPRQPVDPEGADELAHWHLVLNSDLELGTLYTMIAGLLNVLVIYDALAGPFLASSGKEQGQAEPGKPLSKKESGP